MLHYNPVEEEIKQIKFSLYSPEMVRKLSRCEITVPDTYDDEGYPIDGGLMDQRLGVIDPGLKCKTCGGTSRTCVGHFGHIELVRPVIHISFVKHIKRILFSVCEHCGRVVTTGKKRPEKCPYCNKELGEWKYVKPTSFYLNNRELSPTEIREILAKIPDKEVKKLGYDPVSARPEWMVLTALLVPPVKIRPSITLESGEKSEDDLTHKLVEIIRVNQKLKANIEAGAPQLIIEDLWSLLQYHVTTYFDNEVSNIPPARHRSGRPLKTLSQRLKGKEGRFRYNLSGKRVNFSARTVISPDPLLEINEVGVPYEVAEELTIPVAVTDWNLDEVKKFIKSTEYPRALYVIRKDGVKLKVTDVSREKILDEISTGWVIERQLVDGDIVLFNRQPSLHRISMMCHKVKVLPGKTFRLSPTATVPYNADFDGDEMNLHALQLEEARAEALELMSVEKQILSPRHGHAIIKPSEDQITGIWFLTHDKTEFNREQMSKLLYLAGITKLPKPDRGDKYSGKLLFSLLLPDDINVKYTTKLGEEVIIKNGKLLKGTVDSKGSEHAILEQVFAKHGPEFTKWFLGSLTKIALEALSWRQISVSLKNYVLDEKTKHKIKEILDKMNREIDNLILKYKDKTLERNPGMTLKETLEALIMFITSRTRDSMSELVKESLGLDNPSVIMASIGSRGSILNAIQMSAVVGQQAIRNKRPNRGYYKRNLSFYKPGKLSAREKGFVFGHFSHGLEVDEFFQHAMAGRESIVNTAIRTGRSGYMQRRLIHALQDLFVVEDYSVRDSGGNIVQFVYGGDARDPMFSGIRSKEEFDEGPKEDDVDTV